MIRLLIHSPDKVPSMKINWTALGSFSSVFLRAALGASFLSAVADRFGLWGTPGHPHVAWGNYSRFVGYVGQLNWFLPAALIPAVAVISTIAEILFGLLLLVGWQTRVVSFLSGVLLLLFALAMTFALGVKAPLDASVFSASAGAFLLSACPKYPFSVDAWLNPHPS
jgi:uncharacterized membrane protein YphA (DoxX/SURF4 family)